MDPRHYSSIGWGLIGTPNGFQYSKGAGVAAELQEWLAQLVDLPSDVAVVLPNPEDRLMVPLYRVVVRRLDSRRTVLSVVQYVSIQQMGSYRSGTYFGSYMLSLNSSFSTDSSESIVSSLFGLSKHQYEHFIGREANVYAQALFNKGTPDIKHTVQLSKKLLPLFNEPGKILFILAQNDQEISACLELILCA